MSRSNKAATHRSQPRASVPKANPKFQADLAKPIAEPTKPNGPEYRGKPVTILRELPADQVSVPSQDKAVIRHTSGAEETVLRSEVK